MGRARTPLFLAALTWSAAATAGAGHGHGHGGAEHGNHAKEDGLIRISDVGLELSGIAIKVAESQKMQMTLSTNGQIAPNRYQSSQIRARYPGVVKKIQVALGQKVRKGAILATVEANGSESNFHVRASFSGTIIEKKIVVGQFVSAEYRMFYLSNLDVVWAELIIPEDSSKGVKSGQKVSISNWGGDERAVGSIFLVSSTVYKDSQSLLARVEVQNSKGRWRPGSFIKATIKTEEIPHVLSVEGSAVQTLEGQKVVFVEQEEGVFEPHPVALGRRNRSRIEILNGIKAGDRYVSSGSFILKADYLKSEASHDH